MSILCLLLGPLLFSGGSQAPPLETYLDKLASSFSDPKAFRSLAGSTFFDEVPSEARAPFGKPRVVTRSTDGEKAVVLLSAAQIETNGGDQTWTSAMWSGLYEVELRDEKWVLGKRLPYSRNQLKAHDLDVAVDPKVGISVKDKLSIWTDGTAGFPTMLNKDAQIQRLQVDGVDSEYDFQNGLLWIPVSKGSHTMAVEYTIKVERPADGGNSSAFGDEAGHMRGQYYWHPILAFGEQNGLSRFRIRATIPETYQVALDVAQRDSVANRFRVAEGDTPADTTAISLAYDQAWVPRDLPTRFVKMRLFATKDFYPADKEISDAVSRMTDVLVSRFGKPSQDQIKIVQARRRGGEGWFFLSNQSIYAGINGRNAVRYKSYPLSADIGHEVSHLWTQPTGWARFLLLEGWATFAESLLLRSQFGLDTERQFWRDTARKVTANDALMAMSIRDDVSNNGLSYWKGAWLFRMVEGLVGTKAFDKAIQNFSKSPSENANYEGFLLGFGDKRSMVERFLKPWVTEPGLPQLAVRRAGGKIVVTQKTHYWLPNLGVRLVNRNGKMQYASIESKNGDVVLEGGKDAVTIELDPAEAYFLERRIFSL